MSLSPLQSASLAAPSHHLKKRKDNASLEESQKDRECKQPCVDSTSPEQESFMSYRQEFSALHKQAQNYELLEKVESLWKSNGPAALKAINKDSDVQPCMQDELLSANIDRLYKQVLEKHDLKLFYEETLLEELQRAIYEFNPDKLRFLLHKVLDCDLRSHVFELSASLGHLPALKIIVSSGDIVNQSKEKVLTEATSKGCKEVICALLAIPGFVTETQKMQTIIQAAQEGQSDILAGFIDAHELSDQGRGIAVEQSALHGHAESVRLIIDRSGPIAQDLVSRALVHASRSGKVDIVAYLLDTGICESRHREIALQEASHHGHLAVIEVILRNGLISRRARDVAILSASGPQRALIVERLQQTRLRGPLPFHHFFHAVSLSYEEVVKDPEHFLDLIIRQGIPDRIDLLDVSGKSSPVTDVGGVRKGFVTRLFEALRPKLSLNSEALPMFKPTCSSTIEIYKKIGKTLSALLKSNQDSQDPCLIGYVFHERFFEILALLTKCKDSKIINESLANILLEVSPAYQPLANVILHPEIKDHLEKFASLFGVSDLALVHSEAKKVLENYLAPAKALLAGSTPELHELFITNSWQRVCQKLQGEKVSIEALLQAIPQDSAFSSLNLQISWIREKIASSDVFWREQFLFWATEKKAVSPGLRIQFQLTAAEGIGVHTCTNTIDMPEFPPDQKEMFLIALEAQMSDLRYNKA